jgi:hypothetical protein
MEDGRVFELQKESEHTKKRLRLGFVRKVRDTLFSRVIHGGIESGEILAQRPQVGRGGPKGKISELL